MFRRSLFPLALLVAAACESAPPTAPDLSDPSYVLIDATTTGNPFFNVLPPAVVGYPSISAILDRTARPRVEICEWSLANDACVVGGAAFTYTLTFGPGGEVITVSDAKFMLNWDTGLEGVDPGKVFRARVFILSFELGSVDFEIGETGRDVKNIKTGDNVGLVDGRTLPFNFFIGEGAIEEELAQAEAECEAAADARDCDFEVIDGSQGGMVTVFEAPGAPEQTLAAIVTINPNDVVDDDGNPVSQFVLAAQHVDAPRDPPEIPLAQQFPFFVDVTAEDEEGNAVSFVVGAELVLCQPPDLGDPDATAFIPDELHHFLEIFQVREGVTEILETTLDNQENCPGGLHGGLNTVGIKKFSSFGAVLPTDPGVSTAVVPDGTVGAATVIDVQAMLDATNNQIFGGDEVVVTVSGANSATPVVTDNGDGTYTTQYTPLVAGTDMVEIRIRNVETGLLGSISGSPFTSIVTGGALEGFGTPTVDGVNSAGEWDAAGRINVFAGEPNQGSTLYVMNDATNLYLALEVQGDLTFTASDLMEVRFDNTLDGVDTFGDDNLFFSTGAGFGDAHFSGSSWGAVDTSSDGAGAAGTSGGVNFFEIAHPLNSGDQGDFALTSGSVVGYCLRYFDDGTSISATQTFEPGCVLAINEQALYRLIRIAAPPPIG